MTKLTHAFLELHPSITSVQITATAKRPLVCYTFPASLDVQEIREVLIYSAVQKLSAGLNKMLQNKNGLKIEVSILNFSYQLTNCKVNERREI